MSLVVGRPVASLSPGLLARKGAARPAMRSQAGTFAPQLAAPAPVEPEALDDLGWNDMGVEAAAPPAPPPVVVLREALAERIERADEPAARPVSLATAERIGRESAEQTAKAGKSAFTLRLDAKRHLRLRLASAVTHRSAQALVTQALDALLDAMPDVDALAARLPEPAPNSRRRPKGPKA